MKQFGTSFKTLYNFETDIILLSIEFPLKYELLSNKRSIVFQKYDNFQFISVQSIQSVCVYLNVILQISILKYCFCIVFVY